MPTPEQRSLWHRDMLFANYRKEVEKLEKFPHGFASEDELVTFLDRHRLHTEIIANTIRCPEVWPQLARLIEDNWHFCSYWDLVTNQEFSGLTLPYLAIFQTKVKPPYPGLENASEWLKVGAENLHISDDHVDFKEVLGLAGLEPDEIYLVLSLLESYRGIEHMVKDLLSN